MGRRKTKNEHLPDRVTVINGAYWYRAPGEPPIRIAAEGQEHEVWKFMLERTKPIIPEEGARLHDHFERYKRDVLPTLMPRTQKDYARHIALLDKVFGHMKPDELTSKHIGQFLDRPKGKIQANRQVAVLSAMYRKMVGRWYVADRNPCIGVERNESRRRRRYVSDQEYVAMYTVAKPRIRLAMDLALITGQRQGDLLTLTWKNVSDDGIYFEQHKTGKRLLVAQSDTLRAILERAKHMTPVVHIGGYVIRTRSGKPYTSEGFRACWQRTMAKAIRTGALEERFTFHDLRAKNISDTANIQHAFERAGHTSMTMTRGVYDRGVRKVTPLK